MIQRIQTLFLFLSIVVNIIAFFFPFVSFVSDYNYYKLSALQLENLTPDAESIFSSIITYPIVGLLILSIALAVVTISKFKNRSHQLKINKLNIFILIILIAGILFGYTNYIEKEIAAQSSFEIGAYFPLGSLLFLLLANRFILKDEKLVRSADRLR
jgi:hypothetical protein